MTKQATILAIDTSCDDTSIAISRGWEVLSNIVASQNQIHKQFGGVFPSKAKQAHRENFMPALKSALRQAQKSWQDIDAIAVTYGPGLAPALEVGIRFAQNLAKEKKKKLIIINHIEGHALSPLALPQGRMANFSIQKWPKLALVVSGGHTEFILMKGLGEYQILGRTIDDAAGECLDKVGRMLNLGYPAGPLIEEFAKKGNPQRFNFPLPMTDKHHFDLSFSGLKTAARIQIQALEEEEKLDAQTTADLAASIQEAVFAHILYKLERLLYSEDLSASSYPSREKMKEIQNPQRKEKIKVSPIEEIFLGGGVAANLYLRKKIRQLLKDYQKNTGKEISFVVPYRKKLCSDNAAMIAVAAQWHYQNKNFASPDKIERSPQLVLE